MENYMWNEYQDFLVKTLNLKVEEDSKIWIHGPKLKSKLYSGDHILKSRETIIDDGKTKIYNNIVYPKTGENLPCFGMDLMCFFEKKVIVVWDFQHPTPKYDFDHPVISYLLPDMYDNTSDDIRFFEPGNHFSRFVYVRKCTVDDIKKHLINFKRYVSAYEELLYFARPKETDNKVYKKFDQYMLDLDPVIGYMASKFGKDFSEDYVNNFLFSYADT
tara:strand:+ start:44 stop:694 length:651 start_codon:yes stop_codon:yes gene_type:complete